MNYDNRDPNINELNNQIERERAERLRRALKRASKRQQWLAFYGFPLDQKDNGATPSPDEIPGDWNDGSEADYE